MAKSIPRRGAPRAAAKSRKTVTTTDVEVADDAPGMGVDAGLAILTTIMLVAALVLVDMLHGKSGDGFIF